jgi:hypothetical protein
LADKIGEMMDSVIKKNTLVNKASIKVAKHNSDVDFGKIMSDL